MSRWDKHINGGQSAKNVVGEKVDCMEILQVGDDKKSLKLKCPRDDNEFWFDNKDGRNAVMRKAADGKTDEIHAKCPRCGCEWDGEIAHYYGVGFIEGPPALIRTIASKLGVSDDIDKMVGVVPFFMVKAEDALDAMKQSVDKIPPDVSRQQREGGLAVIPVPKSTYEQWQHFQGMKDLHGRAQSSGGSLSDLLDRLFGQSPDNDKRFKGRNEAAPTTDPAADKVMEAMDKESD